MVPSRSLIAGKVVRGSPRRPCRRPADSGGGEPLRVERDIWRATDERVGAILAEEGVEVSEEELKAVLERLPRYLDAALRECVLALATDERERRRKRDGGETAS